MDTVLLNVEYVAKQKVYRLGETMLKPYQKDGLGESYGLKELIYDVAKRTGMKQKDIGLIVRVTFDVIKQRMWEKRIVRIPVFGILYLGKVKARSYILKSTLYGKAAGTSLWIRAHWRPRMKFAHTFRQQIKKLEEPCILE